MVTFLETCPMAENNMRELYEIYLELGHDAFEEKIRKPMEKYLHDGSNFISINSMNTIIANAMQSSKLGEAEFFENPFATNDYDMPPIYNDYNDVCETFTPTITNENVGSNDTFMHVDHDKNALCAGYIVEFIHDATKSYYERGNYGCRIFHLIKTSLYMLKVLKLLLFYVPMLVTLLFMNLFGYKIPMHRKWVRLKCGLNLLLDAPFFFMFLFSCEHH